MNKDWVFIATLSFYFCFFCFFLCQQTLRYVLETKLCGKLLGLFKRKKERKKETPVFLLFCFSLFKLTLRYFTHVHSFITCSRGHWLMGARQTTSSQRSQDLTHPARHTSVWVSSLVIQEYTIFFFRLFSPSFLFTRNFFFSFHYLILFAALLGSEWFLCVWTLPLLISKREADRSIRQKLDQLILLGL